MDEKEFLKKDKFATLLGIELLNASNGNAKTKLDITDKHLNAMDTVHGGAIFSLADTTLAAAAHSYGTIVASVAINVNISFLKAAKKGTLYAEANETSKNNKIAHYNINITNSQGELISCAQGMVYFKKEVV
jgi:acyl-CoA thioesterase